MTPRPEGASIAAGPRTWMDLLSRYGPKKLASHVTVGMAAWSIAQPLVKKLRNEWNERTIYSITVNGGDAIYDDLHEWVLSLLPAVERRALVAISENAGRDEVGYVGEPSPTTRVRLRYDGNRTQTVRLDGHKVTVNVAKDEMPKGAADSYKQYRLAMEKIVFVASSAAGRDAIVQHLERILEEKTKRTGPPPLWIARWGSWDRRDDLPSRSIESVILRKGQLESIMGDLDLFLASEADYNRRSLSWHRGYLFHGKPGTGKTSLVKALAAHFGLPLYYLPLGDVESDNDLIQLVSRIPARSALLLEDIDIFHAATQRDDDHKGTTLSALLNALDGIWTPHGLLTFLTTNERDVLDSAILRPGRIDVEEELGALDAEQAQRLAEWYWARRFFAQDFTIWEGRTPSDMLQAMGKNEASLDPPYPRSSTQPERNPR